MDNCIICGKEIIYEAGYRYSPSWHPRKYCSPKCSNKSKVIQRKIRVEKSHHKMCLYCGEQFISERADTNFCSNKCKQAAYRKRKKDKQAGNRPFILQIGKLHKRLLDTFDYYDIAGYHIADIVQAIPFKENETRLIVRESGEILRTWDEPFEKNYSFENRYTQLTPDMMIRFCDDPTFGSKHILTSKYP